ncbi:apoptosis regulatory protein Siva [Lepisosteus oculatus]|uniref:SIVA1, apoptosis-inducing factor n=1 Tax=Lepisosteus oculatus TaxID=7918 RepID=W5N4Y5_LEPOC|nr:PREDICTED: apoptosis regulatory protein Siva [Lepisosteus oculatus]
MPKRAYPFGESFSLQYKIHIGQKEVNQGVFGNAYRQEIYAKTKGLLFSGAKAVMERIWKAGSGVGVDPDDSSPRLAVAVTPTLLRGQTLIGHDGKLRKCDTRSGAGTRDAPGTCCVCLKAAGVKAHCAQCDRSACPSCSRQCSSCTSLCCSVCTMVDYSDRYDRVLCCDCSA